MRPLETETLPLGGVESLADRLEEARERTLWLVEGIGEEDLDRVHDPLMSPLAWDLGHIAAYEDRWLPCEVGGMEPLRPELMGVYDAFETPRSERGDAPCLPANEVRAYMDEVRERSLETIHALDRDSGGDRLTADGFVLELLVEHEHQHNETMIQTLLLAEAGVFSPPGRRELPPAPDAPPPETVRVEAGPFAMGAGPDGFAYDNERARHEVELPAFEIDATPVTNGAYREWVEGGGYARRSWWSPEGWDWREREGVTRPLHWTAEFEQRCLDQVDPLDPHAPVIHVSWYEADAFARSHGKRLPTEAEWEKAAARDAGADEPRPFPWGADPPREEHANLDVLGWGPAPAGAYPSGAAPCGALGMIGDVWEWTATEFDRYPGFEAFPYREYSEVFFASGYRVLRGGSWATRRATIRNSFRNWDLPQRRQILAGFRCARDA